MLSIDQVKENVENSERALKKVDNWSQLVQEAEQSFQDRDMASIAEKVITKLFSHYETSKRKYQLF